MVKPCDEDGVEIFAFSWNKAGRAAALPGQPTGLNQAEAMYRTRSGGFGEFDSKVKTGPVLAELRYIFHYCGLRVHCSAEMTD